MSTENENAPAAPATVKKAAPKKAAPKKAAPKKVAAKKEAPVATKVAGEEPSMPSRRVWPD